MLKVVILLGFLLCSSNIFAKTYIFVSFSMPDAALKSYFAEAKKLGATLVMQGLKNNSFLETKAKANELGISFDINPNLFEQYKVTVVPTIVTDEQKIVKKLVGHISLMYALKIMKGSP